MFVSLGEQINHLFKNFLCDVLKLPAVGYFSQEIIKKWIQMKATCTFRFLIFIKDIQITGISVSIPHKQFHAWFNDLVRAIVYFTPILEGYQVLLIFIACTVDKAQPVAVLLIPSINNMRDLPIFNNLQKRRQRSTKSQLWVKSPST